MRKLAICCIFASAVLFGVVGAFSYAKEKPALSSSQALVKRLYSPNAEQRASAAISLGRMGPKATTAIPALIERLGDAHTVKRKDGDFFVETCVMYQVRDALVMIGNASVEPLIKAFNDKNKSALIRQNAAEALGLLRDHRAIEPLIEFLKHKDDKSWDEYGFVADRTKTALENITGQSYKNTGQDFGEDYTKWRGWYDKNKSE